MIENRHLRYFLEVARTLHITRAAERLHIAQPALTQNIYQLEQGLGVQLFDRQGRRLSLTEAGHVFEREAEHSLRVFQGAQKENGKRRRICWMTYSWRPTRRIGTVRGHRHGECDLHEPAVGGRPQHPLRDVRRLSGLAPQIRPGCSTAVRGTADRPLESAAKSRSI